MKSVEPNKHKRNRAESASLPPRLFSENDDLVKNGTYASAQELCEKHFN
jgi:hypothetical protein